MNTAVLDTDILSAIMRGHTNATANARRYLADHSDLTISLITRYEILRGLEAKNASRQIAQFNVLCNALDVLPITDAVIIRAANIYGTLRRTGTSIGDADIFVAATALENGLEVITNNTKHFTAVPGLTVTNWLTP